MSAQISYGKTEDAWRGYDSFICNLIEKYTPTYICDIGGGANPLLPKEYISEKEIQYFILDISDKELKKAPDTYNKISADISSTYLAIDYKFDFVFSKMLAEHVKDAKQFHMNVLEILNDGGLAVHFFPTLYTFPFLLNRLIPENLSIKILDVLAPRFGKFPAYYNWCRGPTQGQIQKFVDLGYEVIEYKGFFGHSGYYKRIRILQKLHQLKTKYLLSHPQPLLTSFAYLILRKAQPNMNHDSPSAR